MPEYVPALIPLNLLFKGEESSTAPLLDLSSLIAKILVLNVALRWLSQSFSREGRVLGSWAGLKKSGGCKVEVGKILSHFF